MKIGIISDTHDRLESMKKAIEIFKEKKVETIIHCGDWSSPFTIKFWDENTENLRIPIYSIFGNNDGDKEGFRNVNESLSNPIKFFDKPLTKLELDGRKIAVMHGKDRVLLQEAVDSQDYDIVMHGHVHDKPRNELIGKTLVINPGSTSFTANSVIIDTASVAILETKNNKVEFVKFTKKDLI